VTIAQALSEERDPAGRRRLSAQERRVEIGAAALFTAVAVAMLTAADGWDEPLSAVLLTATYGLVDRVTFLLGPGEVSPTQLVFVPMLFLLPPEAVPALVATGALLGALPEIVLRRAHPERALFAISSSWYAVGPAAVFALLDPGAPGWSDVGVYALALVAQFGVDFVASTLRERLGSGIPARELAPVLGMVYLVDTMLSPIGFMAVLASETYSYAYLLAVPSGGLLALIARERGTRIEHELALGRAYRDQAAELRRARLRVGEIASTLDREGLEQLLLTTTVEAVEADCGRLGSATFGDVERFVDALAVVEIPIGEGQVLAVARFARTFSPAEDDLLDSLAAHARASLENLGLRERERAAAEAVRELSMPVLVVRERLLIVPLVGQLDRSRASQLTDELLLRIRRGRAQAVVIDVTGVPAIELHVATQLVQTVAACGLLGASVIVTGLSSETTQGLVASGVDLRAVHAVADLQRGIEEAQRLL
jgi:anti-anti-sigma regulatory factor